MSASKSAAGPFALKMKVASKNNTDGWSVLAAAANKATHELDKNLYNATADGKPPMRAETLMHGNFFFSPSFMLRFLML